MDSKTNSGNRTKDMIVSLLAGLGIGIGVFLLGTVLLGAVGLFLVGVFMPACWESCPLAVLTLSPLGGGLLAVVGGLVGGRRIHKHVRGETLMNLPKQLSTWFMAVYFLLSGLHGVVFAVFPAATFWASIGNGLWGFESLLAVCVAVLLFMGK